jgi:ABC-type sugar transport system substrate-binding protein
LPNSHLEPWRSLAFGARDEAAQRGVELAVPEVAGADDAERQARRVRELIARRVDFILLGGGDSPAVGPAIDEALARKFPLGGLSSLVPAERLVFKVGPDRFGLGRVQAECLGAALAGRGAVALLAGPADSLPALEPAQGFRETLQKQFPNVQLVAERAASLDRAAAAGQVAEWLGRWPGLAGLATGGDEPTLGALDALFAAGRLGQTKVAVANLGPPAEPSLRDGGIQCASAQQAVAEGRAAVRNALAYLAGQPYEKNVKSPPVLLTRENLEKIDWGAIRAPTK